jgi:hypothetical protein
MDDRQKNARCFGAGDREICAALGIIRRGDLWVTEFILTYDGKPFYTVSIMGFRDDEVEREIQYFPDPFMASASRARRVERMDA